MSTERPTLVLATRNKHKLAEAQALLADFPATVVGLDAFPDIPDVDETGRTFEENAALKAEAVARATGRPALADDSGLAVDALHGEPGVRSARYAGVADPSAADAANNALVLERMRGRTNRACAFVCVLAWAAPGRPTRFFRGETRGRLLDAPRGDRGGFGYDPLFLSDDLGMTFAEATRADKGRVSHRGRALAAWAAAVRADFAGGGGR